MSKKTILKAWHPGSHRPTHPNQWRGGRGLRKSQHPMPQPPTWPGTLYDGLKFTKEDLWQLDRRLWWGHFDNQRFQGHYFWPEGGEPKHGPGKMFIGDTEYPIHDAKIVNATTYSSLPTPEISKGLMDKMFEIIRANLPKPAETAWLIGEGSGSKSDGSIILGMRYYAESRKLKTGVVLSRWEYFVDDLTIYFYDRETKELYMWKRPDNTIFYSTVESWDKLAKGDYDDDRSTD